MPNVFHKPTIEPTRQVSPGRRDRIKLELAEKTVKELRPMARDLGITAWNTRKADLIEAIARIL